MKLSYRKSLQICKALWTWLAANPTKHKEDWPGWKKFERGHRSFQASCPCCEYMYQNAKQGDETCNLCPLIGYAWANDCMDEHGPYKQWDFAHRDPLDSTKAAQAAQIIVDACTKALSDLDAKQYKLSIKQLSTSACETIYEVNGQKLRLFIITGGTPAIEFADDYSFTQRYPTVEKWTDKHFRARDFGNEQVCCYEHQSKIPQGPTFEEVLPHGLKNLKKYLDTNVPLRELRMLRHSGLPIKGVIQSKRVKDTEDQVYVTCDINFLHSHYIPPVTFSSRIYCGRLEEKISFFSPWWKKTMKLFNRLCDANAKWETLSEEQYQTLCNHLKEYKP